MNKVVFFLLLILAAFSLFLSMLVREAEEMQASIDAQKEKMKMVDASTKHENKRAELAEETLNLTQQQLARVLSVEIELKDELARVKGVEAQSKGELAQAKRMEAQLRDELKRSQQQVKELQEQLKKAKATQARQTEIGQPRLRVVDPEP